MTKNPLTDRPEREIVHAILSALRLLPGVVAWRNNTGAVTATYQDKTRFVRFGVPGLSDIIGWIESPIDQRPSGSLRGGERPKLARFFALEVKRPGALPTAQQSAFLHMVLNAGGLAGVVTSVEDAVALIKSCRATLVQEGLFP